MLRALLVASFAGSCLVAATARTGSPFCALHDHFDKWSSVYRRFRRWTHLATRHVNASHNVPF